MQEVMMDILAKGAIAALTDEAQSDTTVFSPLLKSVKIKVDADNITVESATKTLAAQYKHPINKDEITVKESGEVMILAKELSDWSKRQPNSDIILNLKMLDTPQLISIADGEYLLEIKKTVHALGLDGEVDFLGPMKNTDIVKYLQQANLFCSSH